ncbi:MAG: YihY/virulence factor BrkB family protein [Candidatus Rokuibacteriota bacterium]
MLVSLRGAFSRFWTHDGFFVAGGLAFFLLICMIPIVLLAVSTVGFVLSTEQAAREIVGHVTRNFPVYSREITRVLLRIVETRKLSGLLGTVVLVIGAMPLFGAARLVMHRMLGVTDRPRIFRNLVVDAGMVLLLGVLLFAATGVTWVVHWFQEVVLASVDVPRRWIEGISVGLSLVLSGTMFYLGYRYVPYRRVRRGAALTGAVVTSLLWEVAKQVFRLYIRKLSVYDQIYGPLGVLVAFVMFVYYSAIVFVFGAAWVAALDARTSRRS